jgi:hypothetical protein
MTKEVMSRMAEKRPIQKRTLRGYFDKIGIVSQFRTCLGADARGL